MISIEKPEPYESFDEYEIQFALRRLDNAIDEINNGYYKQGFRNNLCIDILICESSLGLDLKWFINTFDFVVSNIDMLDFEERLENMEPYLNDYNHKPSIYCTHSAPLSYQCKYIKFAEDN